MIKKQRRAKIKQQLKEQKATKEAKEFDTKRSSSSPGPISALKKSSSSKSSSIKLYEDISFSRFISISKIGKSEIAILVMNKEGEILSMIGGKSYDKSP